MSDVSIFADALAGHSIDKASKFKIGRDHYKIISDTSDYNSYFSVEVQPGHTLHTATLSVQSAGITTSVYGDARPDTNMHFDYKVDCCVVSFSAYQSCFQARIVVPYVRVSKLEITVRSFHHYKNCNYIESVIKCFDELSSLFGLGLNSIRYNELMHVWHLTDTSVVNLYDMMEHGCYIKLPIHVNDLTRAHSSFDGLCPALLKLLKNITL